MIETITVSSRGQIVIPEKVRKHLSLKEGTKLIMIEKQNKLILELEKDFLEELERMKGDKEKMGWLVLAEKSLAKLWDNPSDEEIWSRYL